MQLVLYGLIPNLVSKAQRQELHKKETEYKHPVQMFQVEVDKQLHANYITQGQKEKQ